MSKNNPTMEDCLNIKWVSNNLLLLGNPRQRLNFKHTWDDAQMILYLVPVTTIV